MSVRSCLPARPMRSIAAYATPRAAYPGTLTVQWHKQYDLRYGENPHQSA